MNLDLRHLFAYLTFIAVTSVGSLALADVSKEACVESHSRGQDAREQGKLTLARKLFMTCAQPTCPSLVQSDCARLADDIERYQPWLTFAARDSEGHDLPDTTVYVDGVLVVTRLDDGKPHEVDPGKHTVRFEYGDRKETVTLVVSSGEKGRSVVATFKTDRALAPTREPVGTEVAKHGRPIGSKILLGASTVMVVGGATLGIIGLTRVPNNCSTSTHECKAAPGDPSIKDASDSIRLSNIGWSVAGVGLAGLTIGVVWYLTGEKSERPNTRVAPMLSQETLGIAVSGRL